MLGQMVVDILKWIYLEYICTGSEVKNTLYNEQNARVIYVQDRGINVLIDKCFTGFTNRNSKDMFS